jgi:F1F0 ATPase subunit 2
MLAGIVQFGSLWWNVRLYAGGGSSIAALIIQFGRFALLTMVLIWLARCGAMPLLSAGVGILLARAVMVRRLGRAA